ncbi:LacI family DNA-binding transcriptional regulator [Microbacteriaceae bacterium VKM Ac-2855]|nr:LacI family DNA-binding transcriptional regulator [Microbacteriaceae bacterium VKM Ac-2855]
MSTTREPRSTASPATLDDVARAAGVSRATASRALNGSVRNVREELRGKVLAAARDLGYVANFSAQSIARGRSQSIALIVNSITEDYFSPIAVGVFRAAGQGESMITMVSTNESSARAARIASALRGQRPRLVIVAGSRHLTDPDYDRVVEELRSYEEEGGRVIAISQPGLPFDTLSIDNVGVGRLIVKRYLELGYREFTVFAGPEDAATPRDRAAGIVSALAEAGIEINGERVIHSAFTREGGYVAAGEYLRRHGPTEAIIATADAIALGAIARFREAGLQLPGDLAISGVDDLVALRDLTPALTTVRLPWNEVGEVALRLGLGEAAAQPRLLSFDGHVVVRESTPRRR